MGELTHSGYAPIELGYVESESLILGKVQVHMSKTSRPATPDQILRMEAKKARKELKDRLWSWFIILLLVGIVAFMVWQVIFHHF